MAVPAAEVVVVAVTVISIPFTRLDRWVRSMQKFFDAYINAHLEHFWSLTTAGLAGVFFSYAHYEHSLNTKIGDLHPDFQCG